MNYRHIYHAGNFADVMKHLALCLVLDHLKKKDTPFCVIDAHGGTGLYDLHSVQARKTMEWQAGIGRFDGASSEDGFTLYMDVVARYLERGLYPGSPLLTAGAIRDADRLIANELHPEDVITLKANLRGYKTARVTHLDAYECIRAHIPPREKRGLVLIDPPFEKTDEFETLAHQMGEWKKRFPTGIYLLWYPIKAQQGVARMKHAATELGLPRTWCVETLLHPRDQPVTFNGSGLILFNAPYMVPERMTALLPFLKTRMGLVDTAAGWLTPE